MSSNSQNSMPIVAAICPADRQCVKNGTDVLKLVEDFCSVAGSLTAGTASSAFQTQDTTGAQALQLAQQNATAIQTILSAMADVRFATNYAPVPPAISTDSEAAISWERPLKSTNYLVDVTFLASTTASLSSAFNWWVVQGSQTTTGCVIHFENAPAKTVGLQFAWTVSAPPNAVSVGPTISGFNPTSGAVGATVTVYGSGFTGTTEVDFNGASASYTVVSDTVLTATVPAGATTGAISIQTGSGVVVSTSSFTVTP